MGWGWCNSNIREDYREEVTLLRDLKKVEGRSQARCNSGEKKSFPGGRNSLCDNPGLIRNRQCIWGTVITSEEIQHR